jgi:prophage maintenance system killer protein
MPADPALLAPDSYRARLSTGINVSSVCCVWTANWENAREVNSAYDVGVNAPGPGEGYQPLISVSEWEVHEPSAAWPSFVSLFEQARSGATEGTLRTALNFALRSAALETGAIEGLYETSRGITRTVALQGAAWEVALDEIGPNVRGHFDAQLDALEHVLDAMTQASPITEVWIREMHALACRNQPSYRVTTAAGVQEQQLHHGAYKTQPNHVITRNGDIHMYCPPDDVPAQMHALVEQLRSPEFEQLQPVAQAAYAHHAFVSIHPFADGNGRVARVLASVFYYRHLGIPLVVFSDQQVRYWDSLLAADRRTHSPFLRFMEDRAMDTMAMLRDRLREASQPISDVGAAVHALLVANDGLTHAELEACGQRLYAHLQQSFSERGQEAGLPVDVVRSIAPMGSGKLQCDFGRPYHTLLVGGGFNSSFQCQIPATASSKTSPIIGVANDKTERFALIVIDASWPQEEPLLLRTDDLHPSITLASEARIRSWVTTATQRALTELVRGVTLGLEQQGYSS